MSHTKQKGKLRSLLTYNPFALTDEEAEDRRWLILGMAAGAGVAVMLVLALVPESARTPWIDFLIAFGAFLLVQFGMEARFSFKRNQLRRAATRLLAAGAVAAGLIAAVVIPSGEQRLVSADPEVDDIVEFVEEEILEPLSIAGAVGAGAKIGHEACGSRCAAAGAVAGAGVGVAINNTTAVVTGAVDAAEAIGDAAHAAGSFLDNAGGPPEQVVQRDDAATTQNLPNGNSASNAQSSPQPTCTAGYGVHGRASCTWN
ncbi:MAG: BCD family MFS transporter [Chloroflexi bacterium]|nr:BCD family MFS transporter [Chloroflexota bacterium]